MNSSAGLDQTSNGEIRIREAAAGRGRGSQALGSPAQMNPAPGAPVAIAGGWWRRLLRLGWRAPKRLRLCESLPLGDRRFVAVVEFDGWRFLVGGTSASLVLLARLGKGDTRPSNDTPGS